MRKPFLIAIVFGLCLALFGCGGGGSGSVSTPPGEPVGVPLTVQLEPSQFVAQTNGSILMSAKVLDGNGSPVSGVQVRFSQPVANKLVTISPETGVTDVNGIATARVSSSSQDFATIEVATQSGQIVRDSKTVYFSVAGVALLPTLNLEVCGNDNDNICNEFDDVTLFQGIGDDQVNVRATVFDRFGERVPGVSVSFGTDTSDVTFPRGSTRTTDINGEASVLVQVATSGLTTVKTVATVTATAGNGAFNATSLFLEPVKISSVRLSASPVAVQAAGTSTLTAGVLTSVGTLVPNGTIVNFFTSCGSVTPFGQTTNGLATGTFSAPDVGNQGVSPGGADVVCSVTAQAGGVISAPVSITVLAPEPAPPEPLTALPGSVTVQGNGANTAQFVITGGTAPYLALSGNVTVVPGNQIVVTGQNLTVIPNPVAATTVVSITVTDSGTPAQATTVTVNVLP